jgi:hypothetical protein
VTGDIKNEIAINIGYKLCLDCDSNMEKEAKLNNEIPKVTYSSNVFSGHIKNQMSNMHTINPPIK